VSFVLLWQPSDCIDLFVIGCIFVLFSENKCDDDDDEPVKCSSASSNEADIRCSDS